MPERLVVVGGDATGMSAASQARRRRAADDLDIVVFERGTHTSYSACGIPYWIGGDVDTADHLIARTPQEHAERGIQVRMRTEVTEIDLERRRVRTRDLTDGTDSWTPFDQLVLATGAQPRRPAIPGIDAPAVHGVQTLDDGAAVLETLHGDTGQRDAPRHAVVIGAGYIGVEMAESLVRRGVQVTVVELATQPMGTLDPDMGALVHHAMENLGIDVVTEAEAQEIRTDAHGRPRAVRTSVGDYPAELVILGLGVRPNTALAQDAELPLGEHGGLRTDLAMRVRGTEGVWAGGDCVEVLDLVSGGERHIPLGTHANKHGMVIGTNIGGDYATFPGVVGTAVSKVCDLEIARTGLLEAEATRAGFQYVTAHVEATSRAGYFPDAAPMTVKILAEQGSGRLLGMQIVGREGAGKRIDTAAVALTAQMTVEQMTFLDLGYAPPFSPVWDPVLVAARKVRSQVR